MTKLPTQPYKGARDFYPEDKRLQGYIFTVMRTVCSRYGYEEYDAPILEPTDLYLQKGNQEIIEEQTYTFEDRGGRSVTMRTEMTPTVSRMVAGRRQELGYPLRWYSIPQCWRYERTQRGRGREFYQLNVDIFGDDSIAAEHELLLLITDLMKSYGAGQDTYQVHISSRLFLRSILFNTLGLDPNKESDINRLIDRKEKMDPDKFSAELSELLGDEANSQKAITLLNEMLVPAKDLSTLPKDILEDESLSDIKQLLYLLKQSGIENIYFNPSITRGFDYYTDIVFEVFDTHPDNNRSMFGGGRYDSLIADFGVEPVPTVGFGMGDHTLKNFLELHDLLPDIAVETDVYAVCVGDTYQATLDIVTTLREQNINVALDVSNRKIEKAIKTAEKKGITYVLFVGQAELDSGQLSLRNIKTGEEIKADIGEISQKILS